MTTPAHPTPGGSLPLSPRATTQVGQIPVPYRSPAFLQLRQAIRAHLAQPVVQQDLQQAPGREADNTPHLILGLSGGPDSLALCAAARAEGLTVLAVCVDHGLQAGSAEVAATAAAQATRLGAAAQVVRVQVKASATGGDGLEAAARQARYAALAQVAAGRPIWVAHTQDDQAETYLLGALRGAPAGMSPRSYGASGTLLHRPFLGQRRATITAALAELGLKAWQDPHNFQKRFRRVALRQQLLPHLGQLTGADPIPALAQAAQRAAAQQQYLETTTAQRWQEIKGLAPEGHLPVAALDAEPELLQEQLVRQFLLAGGARPTAASLQSVLQLVRAWHGQGPVAVASDQQRWAGVKQRLVVAREGGMLVLRVAGPGPVA